MIRRALLEPVARNTALARFIRAISFSLAERTGTGAGTGAGEGSGSSAGSAPAISGSRFALFRSTFVEIPGTVPVDVCCQIAKPVHGCGMSGCWADVKWAIQSGHWNLLGLPSWFQKAGNV